MERRTFLARIVQFFSTAIAGIFALPVLRFLSTSVTPEPSSEWYPVANVSDLTEEVSRVAFTRVVRDGWMNRMTEEYVWVRKNPEDAVVVYEPHCTHLGCAYAWDAKSGQFVCPCHGGKFDANGTCVDGPPPRSLDRYEVRVESDQIKIGKLVKA